MKRTFFWVLAILFFTETAWGAMMFMEERNPLFQQGLQWPMVCERDSDEEEGRGDGGYNQVNDGEDHRDEDLDDDKDLDRDDDTIPASEGR